MDYLDEETLNKIEKEIGITRSKVKDDLDIMRNWVNRQPHLPVLEGNSA